MNNTPIQNQDNKAHLVIDPVAMNIVNRVSPESTLTGDLRFAGGALIQGNVNGSVTVQGGPLVQTEGSTIDGDIWVDGDVFLFGRLGGRDGIGNGSLHATGTVIFAETVSGKIDITARMWQMYEGAQVDGAFKAIPDARDVVPKVG